MASFHVFVVTPTQNKFNIEVKSSTTILDIKRDLEQKQGIPPQAQRLIFAGRECDDRQTLEELGISNSTTFHLSVRPGGGVPPPVAQQNAGAPPAVVYGQPYSPQGQPPGVPNYDPNAPMQPVAAYPAVPSMSMNKIRFVWTLLACAILLLVQSTATEKGLLKFETNNVKYEFGYRKVTVNGVDADLDTFSDDLESAGNFFGFVSTFGWLSCLCFSIFSLNLARGRRMGNCHPRSLHHTIAISVHVLWIMNISAASDFASEVNDQVDRLNTAAGTNNDIEAEYGYVMQFLLFLTFITFSIASCMTCCCQEYNVNSAWPVVMAGGPPPPQFAPQGSQFAPQGPPNLPPSGGYQAGPGAYQAGYGQQPQGQQQAIPAPTPAPVGHPGDNKDPYAARQIV